MLEGLLVDLVSYGARFLEREHDWYNGEGVFYWATGDRWFVTRQALQRFQQEAAEEHATRGDPSVTFGIQTKDGTPIGLFRLKIRVPAQRVAMLSALVGEPQHWGGGYGTDALLLAAGYAFNWLDLRRIWLQTMAPNVRVIRQMEKVGFRLEGRQREAVLVNGARQDVLCYGLLREEWPGYAAMVDKLGLRAREESERC